MPNLQLLLIIAGALFALGACVAASFGWRIEGRLATMREVATASAAELVAAHARALAGATPFGQPAELVGTIECDGPLQAPYSGTLCVAYSYAVTEANERMIGQPGKGGREFEFGGHDSQSRHVPRFYVRDATGRVAVDPAGATLDLVETVARYEAYSGLPGNEREIWREERALPLGNRVYVLGFLGDDGGAPILGRHPLARGGDFMISHRAEGALRIRTGMRAYGLYGAALVAAAAAAACLVGAALI